jgi:hypothetical protein
LGEGDSSLPAFPRRLASQVSQRHILQHLPLARRHQGESCQKGFIVAVRRDVDSAARRFDDFEQRDPFGGASQAVTPFGPLTLCKIPACVAEYSIGPICCFGKLNVVAISGPPINAPSLSRWAIQTSASIV